MRLTPKIKSRLGAGMYTAGILIGLLLAALLTWADFEAWSFELSAQMRMFVRGPERGVENFSCPFAITSHEDAAVSAKINNPSGRQVITTLHMLQTTGNSFAGRQIEERLVFEPGQSFEFAWPLQASDAAWGRLIMTRVFILESSPMPGMASYCGIPVLNFPFLTGNQVVFLTILLAFVCILAGWTLWRENTTQSGLAREKNSRLTAGYAGLIALGVFLSMFAIWVIAALALLASLFLALEYFLRKLAQH